VTLLIYFLLLSINKALSNPASIFVEPLLLIASIIAVNSTLYSGVHFLKEVKISAEESN